MQQSMSASEGADWVELTGERRQVTALFYDMVGSTELLVSNDLEVFATLQSNIYEQANAIIVENKGFVYQNVGDGGLCYFGYPVSLEDSAERAVRASLALIACAQNWQKNSPASVRLRIGIATSVVVIRAGSNEIVGTAPFLAARLQAEAESNSILVSDLTQKLASKSFSFEFVKAAQLKGFSEPVQVWRPIGPQRVPDRFSAQIRPKSSLQGRGEELIVLDQAWSRTVSGTGQSVFIVGDGGIGKSRLVSELRGRIESGGSTNTLIFQCQPYASNNPLYPLATYLSSFFADESRSPENAAQGDPSFNAAGIKLTGPTVRLVHRFFSTKPEQLSSYVYSDSADKHSRDKLITAAIQLICAPASIAPQLVLFEDIHWADSFTIDLIRNLVIYAIKIPMLIVVTQRGELSERFGNLQNASQLKLSGLSKPAMGELIASLWGDRVPRGLVAFVQEKSDGVPLFGEELVGFLSRRVAAGTHTSDWEHLLQQHGIASLNDLISARLAELGKARRSAQVASVIGREFTSALLARLSDIHRPSEIVESELEELVQHGILERKEADGQRIYRFRHILVQEGAYASLLQGDCKLIHQRIARIVVAGEPTGLTDDLAAAHCARGGFPADAVAFAAKAAEACLLRWAIAEADRLLTMADGQLEQVPAGSQRTRLVLKIMELRGLVSSAIFGEGSQETRSIYEKAISICRKQTKRTAGDYFALYWGWWFTAPDVATQQKRAQTLLRDMGAAQDPEIRLQSFHCAWATNFHAAQHEFCLACVNEGLSLYEPERALRSRAIYGGHDAKVCGLGERALSLALTGARAESEAAMKECLAWAEEIDHVGSVLHALYYALAFHRLRRDYGEVIAAADRMRGIANARDIAPSRAKADMYGGWAEVLSGRQEEGMRRFEEGLQLQLRSGIDDNMSMRLDIQAEILELSGQTSQSLALLEQAIVRSQRMKQLFWLPELHRRHTNLRALMGENAANLVRAYKHALKVAQRQGAVELAERIVADLKKLDTGRRDARNVAR